MYARLRQKLAISTYAQTVTTTTSLGSNALSLLMKDLARLITGAITTTAGLNSEIWDIANCEIVNTVPAGWSEYQSTYTTTSTNMASSGSTNSGVIYLRSPSLNTTPDNQPIYKYTGMGYAFGGTLASHTYYRLLVPWQVGSFTGNPTLTYAHNEGTLASAPSAQETGTLHDYILYVTPRAIVWSGTMTTSTQPFMVNAFLEYPNTLLSQKYNHPNYVIYALSNGANAATTGTGGYFAYSAAYNNVGGYQKVLTANDAVTNTTTNVNIGLVFTNTSNMPNGGWTGLWSTSTGTSEASTFKPSTFGTMSDTVDSSGNTVSIPAMPLLHYPAWDSIYDCSSLTGVYATKPGLGANGDTITLNGKTYAYINATTMGYLIPKE